MLKQKNYEIAEYEEKLEKIRKLRKKIENPEPSRLLKDQKDLERRLKSLGNKKTLLYAEIKKIIKAGHELLFVERNARVCFYTGVESEAGHPGICYFREDSFCPTGPIITFSGVGFKELTPKEFIDKLMSGQGFLPKNL